jgi:hypothetical protein
LVSSPGIDGTETSLEQARLLVRRLERLSADSIWARRASGIRAALLKILTENGELDSTNLVHLGRLTGKGFELLEKAAQELIRTRPIKGEP